MINNTYTSKKYSDLVLYLIWKKSLKIPKRKSESVNRRTDNTMAKRKREGQTTQRPKEKEKDRQHNDQKKKRRTDNTMTKR